jgi:hypothetical protein
MACKAIGFRFPSFESFPTQTIPLDYYSSSAKEKEQKNDTQVTVAQISLLPKVLEYNSKISCAEDLPLFGFIPVRKQPGKFQC